MLLETLVSTISAVLTPYLIKGGEEFAKDAGADAALGVKSLYEAIKSKLLVDPKSKQALTHFEQSSDASPEALSQLLRDPLARSRDMQGHLQWLVDKLPPQISVGKGDERHIVFDRSKYQSQANTLSVEKNQTTNTVGGNQTNNNVAGNQNNTTHNVFNAQRDINYKG